MERAYPCSALRLGRFFGVSADFWLNLQMRLDLYRAQEQEKAELATIRNYQRTKKTA